MKPGIPWSVKGIEPEVREAAKHAARRSGMTLGEWLNSMILEQADGGPEGATVEPAAPRRDYLAARASIRDDATRRLEDIADQLSRIARREQESAPVRGYGGAQQDRDTETLSKILSRVESNERQTVEAFTAVNERLSLLGRQVVQAQRPKTERPEEAPAYQSLEKAMRNIVDHIEVSEKRNRETLKGLQDRISDMAQKASSAPNEQVLQSAPAFTRLESRLSDLANRLERSEATVSTGLPDLVRRELSQLTDRIESVREASEALAARAQTAAVQTAQQELREIEVRILGLLKDAQSAFSQQGGSNAEMQRLRAEIASLNLRIDESRSESATDRDVQALRVAIEQLSTRVAQGPDLRPLADMDRRLADITHRLEQSQNQPRHIPQLAELEHRINELDMRLEDALRRKDDGRAFAALEQQISAVSDRVGNTERQLGHLETLERAINQLYESVEQSRNWSQQAAEDAANRMADRLMMMQAQTPAVPSPELVALQDGLRTVRESAISSDRRNQETLEAVHETLEQIVSKLAELETVAVGQQVATAIAQPAALQAEAWQPQTELPPAPSVFAEPFEAAPQQQQIAAEGNPFAPAAAEAPANEVQNPFAPAEPVQEPPVASASTAAATPPADDFIAAARRAAQAASANRSILGTVTPGAATKKSGKTGFTLPFTRKKSVSALEAPSALNPPVKPADTANENKRRRLLLAGIVLLAAMSAYTFNLLGKQKAPVPAKPAVSTENPVIPDTGKEPETAPAAPAAKPPQPRPEGQESGMPDMDGAEFAEEKSAPPPQDGVLTGSLPGDKTEASLASLIAEPGTTGTAKEMPPPEAGPEALRMAAASGDATAQFVIATRYLDGKDISQDFTKAAHWYQKAATAGMVPAQYRIATLFERGKGVPQDVATAYLWYERAAERGNVKAMHNAAVIAAGTQAGKPDYGKAHKWFTMAAEYGLKDSQYNLAVLLERGLGTKANAGDALFWYTLAGLQDDADAKKRADALVRSLAPATVDTVNKRVREWRPKQAPADANVVAIQNPAWQVPTPAPQAAAPAAADDNPIMTAQQLLARLGYDVGTADGKMGSRTANAIRLFQMQSGLSVNGNVSAELLAALRARTG
jgi:localization factor PodJL